MDTTTVYELIGYVGSALIVLSLMMRSLLRLRVINLIGAAVFTVYGVLIAAPPVWVVNGAIVLIDVYELRRLLRAAPSRVGVVEVGADDRYLQHLLEQLEDDIRRFVPSYDGVREAHRAFIVTRELAPAAIVLARPGHGPGEVLVDLDYALPAYRDLASGRFVYAPDGLLARRFDADHVLVTQGAPEHVRYLRRMGFEPGPGDGPWRKDLGGAPDR